MSDQLSSDGESSDMENAESRNVMKALDLGKKNSNFDSHVNDE